MEPFRLLTRTRQVTEYSCGACALQAVLSHWGKDVDEEDLMKILHTTSEEGTYPENIVRGAQALGFEAEAREKLTLDDVQQFTANGDPMIALAQVWRSEKNSPGAVSEEWDTGHYIVVLGLDKDNVYFQDPYARMGKAFMPRKTFVEHWHQLMGGELKKIPKLMQLGIFVRGKQTGARKSAEQLTFSKIDFEKFGSLNLMITQFPRAIMPYDFLNELKDIWADGNIRPDVFIFLRRDRDGHISGMEGSCLNEGADIAAINAVIASLASRSIGSPELARSKAEAAVRAAEKTTLACLLTTSRGSRKIPPEHSAIIILFGRMRGTKVQGRRQEA